MTPMSPLINDDFWFLKTSGSNDNFANYL
jgi:hypothetical protein